MPRERQSSSSPISVLAFLTAFAVGGFSWTLEARADEAYVCEGGRVVYVRLGELQEMSRSDPCLAAHYARGKRPQGAVTAPTVVAGAGAKHGVSLGLVMPPVPDRKPLAVTGEVIVVNEPAPQTADAALKPKVEQVVFTHETRAARPSAESGVGATPADFRRIPIINAGPGSEAIFHHTR